MKDHFCPVEKEMIGFEGVCNWCGAKESTGWRKRQIANDIHSCSPFCERPMCVAVREAVLAEREACAKLCDELANDENTDEYINGANWCSVRIRARGQS